MKSHTIKKYKQAIDALGKSICIDIFGENATDYLQKLTAASKGRYELDDYDHQVISLAMEQFSIQNDKQYTQSP